MKTTLLSLILLLLTGNASRALEITSVVPARATPATPVTVTGGPFSVQSRVFLGEQLVAPTQVMAGQLMFLVPSLPSGSYSLTVQDDIDLAVQPFNFEVLAPRPHILSITPDNLDVCSDEPERQVQVTGRHFLPDSTLLLNGNAVVTRVIDDGTLEFRLPEVPAGVYGVVVHNRDGTTSLPHALWVNNVPEIITVERGEEFVNYYQMIIHGKNFFYNSILVINEPQGASAGMRTRQLNFTAAQGGAIDRYVFPGDPPGEKLVYTDCQTLVYHRYPNNPQNKELSLQVINPDGKKTNAYTVNLP